jgi:hypothetical protein
MAVQRVRNQSRDQRGAYQASRYIVSGSHIATTIPGHQSKPRNFVADLIARCATSAEQLAAHSLGVGDALIIDGLIAARLFGSRRSLKPSHRGWRTRQREREVDQDAAPK